MSSILAKPVSHRAPAQYKGYTITRASSVQVGYLTAGSRNESFRFGKSRKLIGYEVTGGHLDGVKWCDTMREAREYIDIITAEPNAGDKP